MAPEPVAVYYLIQSRPIAIIPDYLPHSTGESMQKATTIYNERLDFTTQTKAEPDRF